MQDKSNPFTVIIKDSGKVIGEMGGFSTCSSDPIEVGNKMARFVWVDNRELHDKFIGVNVNAMGKEYSTYSHKDEGFIYDLENKLIIMDFGYGGDHDPTCGTAPNQEILGVMLAALNSHQFNKESK
jgi:hypothetical protein